MKGSVKHWGAVMNEGWEMTIIKKQNLPFQQKELNLEIKLNCCIISLVFLLLLMIVHMLDAGDTVTNVHVNL